MELSKEAVWNLQVFLKLFSNWNLPACEAKARLIEYDTANVAIAFYSDVSSFELK